MGDGARWYHTIDLSAGRTERGLVDLRHALDLLPWPNLTGKRCLDLGTRDGFFALELERRGAAEVVAVELSGLDQGSDHVAAHTPAEAVGRLADEAGLRASFVEAAPHDLGAELLGTFDVVVSHGLLTRVPDPLALLARVRALTRTSLLAVEAIDAWSSLVARQRPRYHLHDGTIDGRWWRANSAGFRRMVHVAGFGEARLSPPFVQHSCAAGLRWRPASMLERAAVLPATRDFAPGVLSRAVLAYPRG